MNEKVCTAIVGYCVCLIVNHLFVLTDYDVGKKKNHGTMSAFPDLMNACVTSGLLYTEGVTA